MNAWGIDNIKAFIVDREFLPARTYVTVLLESDFYRGLQKLSGKPFWTNKPTFALQELLAMFYANGLETMYVGHDRFVSSLENERTVMRSCANLKAIDNFLRSRGCNHLVFFHTNIAELLTGIATDSLVQKYLKQTGIKIIYLRERPEISELSSKHKQDLFYDTYHLNETGHALWGKIVHKDLSVLVQNRSDPK